MRDPDEPLGAAPGEDAFGPADATCGPAPALAHPAASDDDPLQAALGDAYRHLAMRDRTEAEIRACLSRRGHTPDVAGQAVAELRRQGYVDDARFARRFAEDRRALDGWGGDRIRSRLAELGVPAELVDAAAAWAPEEELAAAVDLLRRRLTRAPSDERERQRALGLLVRRGFELDLAYDAIRRVEREAA
jgi:regulatory protein